jgi:hypothetical protein
MKKLARLSGLLSIALPAVGLVASSSASATGYLLLPVGATIAVITLPETFSSGTNIIRCPGGNFTTTIASVHLIGPYRAHLVGCTAEGKENSGCPVNSVGESGGLILTEELHGLIGLGLPGNLPALLILPVNDEEIITELAQSTNKTTKAVCTAATATEGSIGGLLLQTIGTKTTRALLNFVPKDPERIALPLGGTVTPRIQTFGSSGEVSALAHLSYNEEVELMP